MSAALATENARPPRVSAGLAAAVGVSAAAMVATLPGRTHGLGLVTEPLLADLALDRVAFAALNLWATLAGALFCLPVGRLIDRLGVRAVLSAVLLALGGAVLAMARLGPGGPSVALPAADGASAALLPVPAGLFVLVLLTRGLGQSALSVVSLALIGKAAGKRPGAAVGAYSFLVALGFMAAFAGIKHAFEGLGASWREVWAGIGWALIGFGAFALLVVRNPLAADREMDAADPAEPSHTLGAALRAPGFWVFALATSFYGLVAAATSLFGQSLLAERGFGASVFRTVTVVSPLIGLAANLLTGWLAIRVRLGVLLAAALALQAAALGCFPLVNTLAQVYAYAVTMGLSGGALTVVFFTVWRQAFGPAHLGSIQGAAQLLTVLASAAGPLVLAAGHRAAGSYGDVMQSLALVAAAFAVAAWAVPLPEKPPSSQEQG